jgi:hypothetical protein
VFWSYREEMRNNMQSALLQNVASGTYIAQLLIRNTHAVYKNIVFEGYTNHIALFSGGNIPASGILRVHPNDIIAIVI